MLHSPHINPIPLILNNPIAWSELCGNSILSTTRLGVLRFAAQEQVAGTALLDYEGEHLLLQVLQFWSDLPIINTSKWDYLSTTGVIIDL